MDIDEVSSKTNFDAVKSYIENIIIKDSKVASMKVLQHVYGDDVKINITVINWNRKYKKNFQGFFNLFNQATCALK